MSSLSMARQLKSLIPLALGVAVLTTTGAARLPEGGTTKGVSFKLVMTLKQPITRGQKATELSILHGTGTFANGRGRIDIDSSTGPVAYAKGDYFVIDSGHTILVRPSVQTCSEIESPIEHPLGRMVSQLANQQLGKSGVKVEMEWLGRTDSVAQTTTQHYRVQSEYAIDFGARQLHLAFHHRPLDRQGSPSLFQSGRPDHAEPADADRLRRGLRPDRLV